MSTLAPTRTSTSSSEMMTLDDTTFVQPHPLNDHFQYLQILNLQENQHVTIVALNRPHKRNAIHSKLWKEIGTAFSQLGSRGDGCRAIVLIGLGQAFCAGIDVTDPKFFGHMMSHTKKKEYETTVHKNDDVHNGAAAAAAADSASSLATTIRNDDIARRGMAFLPMIQQMQACFSAIESCPIPVICAIHGPCIGAGVDLACCADVRLACHHDHHQLHHHHHPSNTVFSVREVRLGLAADVGTLQRFPKLCGHGSRVRELCLTGEDFDAHEAYRIGFISRVVESSSPSSSSSSSSILQDLIQNAIQVACTIANHSPVAVVGTKLSLNYSRDHSVSDGLHHIATHNALALMSKDLKLASGGAPKDADGRSSSGFGVAKFPNLAPHARL